MAYGNGFPVTYPQMYPQYQQPYSQNFQQSSPQGMTPPTIHADIIQIGGEQEAWNYPAGSIMMARDESAMFIKSTGANGTPTLVVYEKRAKPAPGAAPDYVTKEELEKALKALRSEKGAAE